MWSLYFSNPRALAATQRRSISFYGKREPNIEFPCCMKEFRLPAALPGTNPLLEKAAKRESAIGNRKSAIVNRQ
jgi:hypothetical protein